VTNRNLDAAASPSRNTEPKGDVYVDAVGHGRRFCQLLVADGKYPNRSVSRICARPIVIGDRRFPVESADGDRIGEAARILRARNGRPGMKPDRVGIQSRRRLIDWYENNLRANPLLSFPGWGRDHPSSFDGACPERSRRAQDDKVRSG
jgi:hypothetical protein